MENSNSRWEQMYSRPLVSIPRHFAAIEQSPFLLEYLKEVLKRCPRGASACETGTGSGFGPIWLSMRGVQAEGTDLSPLIVERARAANDLLGGSATFRVADAFQLFLEGRRFDVVHHQGVLEHFTVPQIRAILAQQVGCAQSVVLSVPSCHYPFEPEFSNERLLPIEEWERILEPFDVEMLKYYGDPKLGGQEQILSVLRGQEVDDALREMMTVPEFPPGISAIVHTRNEAGNLADCLQSLSFADEIIVCDMESTDTTLEVARVFTDNIMMHPVISQFDRARNASATRANFRWILYVDADERIPTGLATELRAFVERGGDGLTGLILPFRNYFCGHWMQCLYPGYTAPRLVLNGKFSFNTRLHSGAQVDGKVGLFPADRPEFAVEHLSYPNIGHYLDKLNRYTSGEAESMDRDQKTYSWQKAVAHFVEDFQLYYNGLNARRDESFGFIYTFFSAFYRFTQHARLFERRAARGQLEPAEMAVPGSLEEMLEFALTLARQRPPVQAPVIAVRDEPGAAEVAMSAPLLDRSGYGESCRNLLFALDSAGVPVSANPIPWGEARAMLPDADNQKLEGICTRPARPGFIQIVQNFPPGFVRHPHAGTVIGRTVFETDRLPAGWAECCNQMDRVWIPSEFNRETFIGSGVAPAKLVVVPECFDPAALPSDPMAVRAEGRRLLNAADGDFVFLSVYEWTLHKGWDVNLRAFFTAFKERKNVRLVFKVWSSLGYSLEDIRRQAMELCLNELAIDLEADGRVTFIDRWLEPAELNALYQGSDCYLLAGRGEGWGMPTMEAMARGIPAISVRWGGSTAFMNEGNSFLCDYELVAVPEKGWREVATYRGHRWAEPVLSDVVAAMQKVVNEPDEARRRGEVARLEMMERFSRPAVGRLAASELGKMGDGKMGDGKMDDGRMDDGKGAAKPTAGVCVRWEGPFWNWHSLAHVNRELAASLARNGEVSLSLLPTEGPQFDPRREPRFAGLADLCFNSLPGPAAVHVRHQFPPRFDLPTEGKLVICGPWEYGFLPSEFIEPLLTNVAEVWCNSEYVRQVYLNSGIPADRLQMVPLGVETRIFNPQAPPYNYTLEVGAGRLNTARPPTIGRTKLPPREFRFLYVGGTIHRKGFDILLSTFLRAFSAYDNVVLVVKDTGADTVYRGNNQREEVKALAEDPSRPRIVYLDTDLSPHILAGIYTSCDCFVGPYRGEGFCLPALEAMACGLPVIVPEGGPTDDFIDDTVGWRIEAERKPRSPVIGNWTMVGTPWQFEVDADVLASAMRHVFSHPEEARAKGAAGAIRAAEWTWDRAAKIVTDRLTALAGPTGDGKPVGRKTNPGATSAKPNRRRALPGAGLLDRPIVPIPSPIVPVPSPISPPPISSSSIVPSPIVPGRFPRRAPTLSLCMIVRNEEKVFDECLASAARHVDEIIVVDTGSTDKTMDLARGYGARIFQMKWDDDFSAARNLSLSKASKNSDWIIWLDADDTLPAECGEKLRDLLLTAEDRTAAFMMKVMIPPGPGGYGVIGVDHLKIFRNKPEHRFEGRIHEQMLASVRRAGGDVKDSGLWVVHSGYDRSEEGQKRKRHRDMTILAKDLADRPDHPFVLFNYGMTHHHLGAHQEAIPYLEKSLALSHPHDSTVRKIYAMLAGSRLELGDVAAARAAVDQGLALYPRDPELLFRAGLIYRMMGDLAGSERNYLLLLNDYEVGHTDSLDITLVTFKGRTELAELYRMMGRLPEAEAQVRVALEERKDYEPGWLLLREIYVRMGRLGEAAEIDKGLARRGQAGPAKLVHGLRQIDGGRL